MEFDFDILVIGSGAGGGTLAAACAASGRRVALVDRGREPVTVANGATTADGHDEQSTLIDKGPYDDRLVELNGVETRLYMGGVAGGGTSVYGGALIRPHAADFSPGRYYGTRLPTEIWDWPIEFDSLKPFFVAAEQLYRVADTRDSTASFAASSEHDRGEYVVSAFRGLPLAPVNGRLMVAAQKNGLAPYRLPLAIDSSRCLECDHCAGFVCPTGARRSSFQLVQESIARGESLTVMQNCEVERLERGLNGRLKGVWVRRRSDDSRFMIRARRYVMSAGAIGTPSILMKSGFEHPHLGRNYMMHYSPLAVGLFARCTDAHRTFVKQIGISDFYFGTKEFPEKMGIVQSLPAPGPLMMQKSGMKRVPRWLLNLLRSRLLPLIGIIEDLPNPENRVTLSSTGTIQLQHRYSDYDYSRGAALSRQMVRLLRSADALHCVSGKIPSREHVAHQCGTVRFGTARKHAVADPDCRLFDQPDVFIADGSFMPGSLGVGPSLTIIANALRVAEIISVEAA